MSKIPYFFKTPTPRYFEDNGWFNPKKDFSHLKKKAIIDWCFSRCSPIKRKIHQFNRDIELDSYEFICGRNSCADELGLTEGEVRHLIKSLVNQGFLIKTSNSVPNKYNCYRWIVEKFTTNRTPTVQPTLQPTLQPTEVYENQEIEDIYNQANNQQNANCTTNRTPQSRSIRSIREKEEYIPSASPSEKIVGLDFVNENFEQSSSQVNPSQVMESQSKHNVYYSTTNSEESETKQNKTSDKKTKNKQKQEKEQIQKIAFRENVFLTQVEHDKLLSEHGQIALEWMLNKLHHSKNAYGYKYKSDYSAIHSWVIDAYSKSKSTTNNSNSNTSDLRRVRDINGNYIKNPHEGSF